MKQQSRKPIIEMSVSVDNGQLKLNFHSPIKWFGFFIASFILWRVPELWKAIETAYSLLGK
jgi:hypothetical protein